MEQAPPTQHTACQLRSMRSLHGSRAAEYRYLPQHSNHLGLFLQLSTQHLTPQDPSLHTASQIT